MELLKNERLDKIVKYCVRISYLGILVGVVLFAVSFRFADASYPDSTKYLVLVDVFKGNLPYDSAIPPFCYRPLLPLIVALLPFDPIISFAFLNLIFTILFSWTVFFLADEFNNISNDFPNFVAAFASTAAYTTKNFGAAVIVDPPAVFFFTLSLYMVVTNTQPKYIAITMIIGILFKEIVLFACLGWYFFNHRLKRDTFHATFTFFSGVLVYLLVRLFWYLNGVGNYVWNFHLTNFSDYPIQTFLSVAVSFVLWLPIIMFATIIYFHQNRRHNRGYANELDWLVGYTVGINWLVDIGLPLVPYLILGLFFARFDVRFLWLHFVAMIPFAVYAAEQFLRYIGAVDD